MEIARHAADRSNGLHTTNGTLVELSRAASMVLEPTVHDQLLAKRRMEEEHQGKPADPDLHRLGTN